MWLIELALSSSSLSILHTHLWTHSSVLFSNTRPSIFTTPSTLEKIPHETKKNKNAYTYIHSLCSARLYVCRTRQMPNLLQNGTVKKQNEHEKKTHTQHRMPENTTKKEKWNEKKMETSNFVYFKFKIIYCCWSTRRECSKSWVARPMYITIATRQLLY